MARATSAFTSARVDWPAGGFHCVASTAIAPVALARMDMAIVICLTLMMLPLLMFHELIGWSAARLMALAAFLVSVNRYGGVFIDAFNLVATSLQTKGSNRNTSFQQRACLATFGVSACARGLRHELAESDHH